MIRSMLEKESAVCFALAPRLFAIVKKTQSLRTMCVKLNAPYLSKNAPQQTINSQNQTTPKRDDCSLPIFYGFYPNGELKIWDELAIVPKEVLLFAEVQDDVNRALFSVFFLCRYLYQRGVQRLRVAMPFFPYLRQDKPLMREPEKNKFCLASPQAIKGTLARRNRLVPRRHNYSQEEGAFACEHDVRGWDILKDFMRQASITHLYTLDAHTMERSDYYSPHMSPFVLHNIAPQSLFATKAVQLMSLGQLLIIAPDQGGQERAQGLAEALGADIRFVQKERDSLGRVQLAGISGEVKGHNCLIYDDILDSGGTLQAIAHMLKRHGALALYALVTHGIFSKGLPHSLIETYTRIYVSDSLRWDYKKQVCPLLGQRKVVRVAILPFFLQEVLQKFQSDK